MWKLLTAPSFKPTVVLIFCFSPLGLYPRLYPELSQYMGLSLNEEEVQRNLAVAAAAQPQGVGTSHAYSKKESVKTKCISSILESRILFALSSIVDWEVNYFVAVPISVCSETEHSISNAGRGWRRLGVVAYFCVVFLKYHFIQTDI